jgi:hypothetical protein
MYICALCTVAVVIKHTVITLIALRVLSWLSFLYLSSFHKLALHTMPTPITASQLLPGSSMLSVVAN